jgi:hypothetical protein
MYKRTQLGPRNKNRFIFKLKTDWIFVFGMCAQAVTYDNVIHFCYVTVNGGGYGDGEKQRALFKNKTD